MPILETVIAGLITKAVTDLSARLAGGAHKTKGKRNQKDIELASQLASQEVLQSVDASDVTLAVSTLIKPTNVIDALDSTDAKSLVHELLALHLVGDPQYKVDPILQSFKSLLRAKVSTTNEQEVDTVAVILFQYIDARCEEIVFSVTQGKQETVERIRAHANYALIRKTLESIERHSEALLNKGALDDQEIERFIAKYKKQVTTKHGSIILPDFERKRKFPVEDLYVDARLVVSHSGERKERSLTEIQGTIDRTVILGDPGGGKSTAAAVLAHRLAQSNKDVVPFLIVLRDFPVADSNQPSILEFIELKLNSFYQTKAPTGAVEALLLSGRAQIVFDGLDELIDTTRRREVTDIVEMFCSLYPLTKVLVTSREVGYEQAPVDEATFSVMRITRFSDDQVREYVENWFRRAASDDVGKPADLANSFMDESSIVAELRGNPLLLSLMCIMYRGEKYIPRNRPELYEKCATMLFDKWDSSRKIYVEVEVAHLVDVALKHLAWWIFTREDYSEGVRESDLVNETARYLLESAFENDVNAKRAARQFIDFCKGRAWVFSDAGSTADGESLYKFTHRTFLEYFAAYEASRRSKSSEKLARQILPHISKGEWDVVAQLAVQIENKNRANGANRILDTLLKDKVKRAHEGRTNVLSFICRCLEFHTPPPQMIREIASRAVDIAFLHIDSGDPRPRGLAYQIAPLYQLLDITPSHAFEVLQDQLKKDFESRISDPDLRNITWYMILGFPDNDVTLSAGVNSYTSNFKPRWDGWLREFIDANKANLEKSCQEDRALRATSILDSFRDIDDLANFEGSENRAIDRYRLLFTPSGNSYYAWTRIPAAFWLPHMSTSSSLADSERSIRQVLGKIGRWATQLPQPPWIHANMLDEPRFFYEDAGSSDSKPFNADEFLGAALLQLPVAEQELIESQPQRIIPQAPGADTLMNAARAISDNRLLELVKARAGHSANIEIPDGVDEKVAKLLTRWAKGEQDFLIR